MAQFQGVPGPSQDSFNTLSEQIDNLHTLTELFNMSKSNIEANTEYTLAENYTNFKALIFLAVCGVEGARYTQFVPTVMINTVSPIEYHIVHYSENEGIYYTTCDVYFTAANKIYQTFWKIPGTFDPSSGTVVKCIRIYGVR